jgi:hypothetical protein
VSLRSESKRDGQSRMDSNSQPSLQPIFTVKADEFKDLAHLVDVVKLRIFYHLLIPFKGNFHCVEQWADYSSY